MSTSLLPCSSCSTRYFALSTLICWVVGWRQLLRRPTLPVPYAESWESRTREAQITTRKRRCRRFPVCCEIVFPVREQLLALAGKQGRRGRVGFGVPACFGLGLVLECRYEPRFRMFWKRRKLNGRAAKGLGTDLAGSPAQAGLASWQVGERGGGRGFVPSRAGGAGGGLRFSPKPEENFPSGAKARVESAYFVPGINPWPTARRTFSPWVFESRSKQGPFVGRMPA